MVMLPTASRNIAVMTVVVAAVRILPPTRIHPLVVRRFCKRIKNAAVWAVLRADCGVSRTTVASWSKKKPLSFPQ
jgi:hypothetical protein